MPLPARRVFSLELALRLGGVDHLLYATANAAGRFGLARPDRLDDPQDQRRINRTDGKITNSLAVVVLSRLPLSVRAEQRHQPLIGVLGIFPTCPIGFDEPLGSRSERDRLGRFDAGGGFSLSLGLDRVSAIATDLASFSCFLARLFKAHVAERPEPMPARASVKFVAKQPALGAALRHLEIQPTAIRVHAARCQMFDLLGGQFAVAPRHLMLGLRLSLHTPYIHFGVRFGETRWN